MFTQYIYAVLFTIIFATLLQSGYSQEGDDWNYLVLSLTWPPTFCSKAECKLPPRMNDFNIHGLWPSVWPGRQPTNCSAHPAFDIDKLSDLRGQLDSEWVNLMDYQNPIPFWEHEWYKHGQCATEDSLISDELGYFNTSLILKDKIDLLDKLNAFGIQPVNDQLLGRSTLLKALHEAYNVRVLITCQKLPKHQRRHRHNYFGLLSEVRFCFTPQLELIDCPMEEVDNTIECPKWIEFPEFN
ncbi:unnamed protein product [Trichobilharzia szidati]|nr:unnamed protein product [Trichobilharzia szidati]